MVDTTRMILAVALGATLSVAQAQAQELAQVAEYALESQLEMRSGNFHP